jgi:esterase/lipase
VIWDYQEAITRRLLLWAALSIAAGAVMLLSGDAFWRGFGLQAVAWGVIDAAIALFGRRSSQRRRAASPPNAETQAREARNLRRLLWINAGLDVLYVTGGLLLVYTLGRDNPFAAGNGWGVVLQGAFLFLFDLLHALTVPGPDPGLPSLAALDTPEHQPLTLDGGAPAAVLAHGFGGTPAEMRGLAYALHGRGWTVNALLLPGFGSDITTLTARRYTEWVDAVAMAAVELTERGHRPVMLVGYSMGAAASILAAQDAHPAALVLLAPFRWPEPWWMRGVEFIVRPFLPIGFRPLRKADFSSPQLREGIGKFMPGMDLDDPQVQAALRDFRVPLGLIDELRGLSRRVTTEAPRVGMPALIVQGQHDTVVRAAATQRLAAALPAGTRYLEVDAGHDLVWQANPAWPEVSRAVTDFADEVKRSA